MVTIRFHIPRKAGTIKAVNVDFMSVFQVKFKVRYPAHVSHNIAEGLRGERHGLCSTLPSVLLSLVPISCCLNAPVLLQSTEMERAKEGGGSSRGGGERGADEEGVKCLCMWRDKVEGMSARKPKRNAQRVKV